MIHTIDQQADRLADGHTDGRTDERTDRRTDGCVEPEWPSVCVHLHPIELRYQFTLSIEQESPTKTTCYHTAHRPRE